MKRICAWCQKEMHSLSDTSDDEMFPITHGICDDCVKKVMADEAIPLKKFLDRFAAPVLLVEEEGKAILANDKALAVLGKKPQEVNGQLGGDVFDCRYAKLPGGCGNTIHCKTCTIRLTVTDTALTGLSHIKVEAYQDLHLITGDRTVRFLISTEKVGKAVFLRIDDTQLAQDYKDEAAVEDRISP